MNMKPINKLLAVAPTRMVNTAVNARLPNTRGMRNMSSGVIDIMTR